MSEHRLTGVEIFACGTHRGKTYTARDLDSMAKNFKRFSTGKSPRLRVPAVLGHDEDQVTLRGSGLPAAAWCERVYRDGEKLKADFADVPPQVMRLLRNKVYRTVSAEIYDEPPQGCSGSQGKMLRRVAFLGGDIPQVKSLEEIPVPEAMSERFDAPVATVLQSTHYTRLPDGAFACFSEVIPVSTVAKFEQDPGQKAMWAKADATGSIGKSGRFSSKKLASRSRRMRSEGAKHFDDQGNPLGQEQLLAALQDMGADVSVLQGVSPEALAEILRVCDDAMAGDDDEDDADDMADDDKALELPDPKDDDEKTMFAERARKLASKARKYWEKYCPGQKFGEGTDTDVIEDELTKKAASDAKGAEKMSERQIASMVQKAVETALAGRVKGDIAHLTKFAEEQLAHQKKMAIDTFCESRLREGKILPYELDAKNPTNLKARLYRADSRAVVTQFSEHGKKIELTELDLQMREIDARRPFKFGETVRVGGTSTDDDEIDKVTRFGETFLSKALEAAGRTPEDYVNEFKTARKAKPTLTAVEYGVHPNF